MASMRAIALSWVTTSPVGRGRPISRASTHRIGFAFSFEIGDYKATTAQVGDIAVTVAFSQDMARRWEDEILEAVSFFT